MDHLTETLKRVEAYALASGATPEGVCRAATGNPRLYERLKRRVEQTAEDIRRIEKHIADNPLDEKRAARHTVSHGDRSADVNHAAAQ